MTLDEIRKRIAATNERLTAKYADGFARLIVTVGGHCQLTVERRGRWPYDVREILAGTEFTPADLDWLDATVDQALADTGEWSQ
ncbi:MAG: hypothetical protein INF12_14655 [Methylobacterium sp.]|nr:hypothetical protein [Methylobacterium sp.]